MTAPLILPTNSIKDSGYNVDNSIIFERSDTTRLSRTNSGTSTNDKKGTFSGWWKLSNTQQNGLYNVKRDSDGVLRFLFSLNTNGTIGGGYRGSGGSPDIDFTTGTGNALFRDQSAWYHIVVNYDTTDSTAANRLKLFVNNVQHALTFTSDIPQNTVFPTNTNGEIIEIGHTYDNGDGYQNGARGYLCEMAFVDGQQLAPTEFGEYDSDTPNVWKPKDISDITFGTLGFYYEFKNSGALGTDSSGNSNTATVQGTPIQTTDTCTNNSANLLTFTGGNTNVDGRSQGMLISTSTTSQYAQPFSSIAINSGKFYWEMKYTAISGTNTNSGMGIVDTDTLYYALYSGSSNSFYYSTDGQKVDSGSASSYGDSQSAGDIVQCAFDATNGAIWFGKNGTWQNSATQSEIEAGTTTNAAFTSIPSGHYHAVFCDATASKSFTVEFNFGSPTFSISSGNADDNGYGNFEYDVPAGFYALNTKNLAQHG